MKNSTTTTAATAFEILRACKTKGGATLDPMNQRDILQGFAVGLGGAESLPMDDAENLSPSFIEAVRDAIHHAQRMEGRAGLGAWVHAGRVFVEPVNVMDDKGRAMRAARDRGEIAIFDLNTGTEIPTK